MILHASFTVTAPRAAAEALAQLFGGEAFPLPNLGREAWMAMQLEGAIDLQQMVLYQEYFMRMDLRQKAQSERIDEARARVLNQRDILIVAHRELEAIEMLKERDEKAWREAIDKAEAELLDELATVRYARRDGNVPTSEEPR